MKKLLTLALCFMIFLTGCTPSMDSSNSSATDKSKIDVEFTDLDDEKLLEYVENKVYIETIDELNSNEYVVEEVRAIYLSPEYIEEVLYNSQSNVYFGYTIDELDAFFQDSRYVFTLGEEGTTTVQELQEIAEIDSETILKNVGAGTGVILICVTATAISAGVGAPAAVTAIFAASAKSATTFALSSSAISAASAGIVKGYQTGDMKEALSEATLAASDGFKWGAISGAVVGGGSKAFLLKAGTKTGLTMSEVALIQKESKYPIKLISRFNSVDEYNIYMKAGLNSKKINGKTALVRKIDLDYVDELTGKTNLQLMKEGHAPINPATGSKYQLHHIGQKNDSPLAILTKKEHMGDGNNKILHYLEKGSDNPSKQSEWVKIKANFWKDYAKQAVEGGI